MTPSSDIWQHTGKQVRLGAYRPLQKGDVFAGTGRVTQEITLCKRMYNHIWILNIPSQKPSPFDIHMPNKIAVIVWIINEITEEFIWEYLTLTTHKNALSSLPLIPTCWSKDKITAVAVFSGLMEKVRTSRFLRTQQNHKKGCSNTDKATSETHKNTGNSTTSYYVEAWISCCFQTFGTWQMSFHILSEFVWGQVTNTQSGNTFTRGLKLFWMPSAF